MITLKNISLKIKSKQILNDISCNFDQGKMHLILGSNGAGKSTLIKIISGELKPSEGEVKMNDVLIKNISLREFAKFRSVLSQNIELSFPLAVHEVVMMGRYPHFEGKPDNKNIQICNDAMRLFDVEDLKDRDYLNLSGGEKQRVQFARVFAQIWEKKANQSRLLLLDEPLTFLDIYYQYDLMAKIKDFMLSNSDLTVIGVVHDMNIAAKFSDQSMLLKDQCIYKFGPTKEVLTEKNIFDVFNIRVNNQFEVH